MESSSADTVVAEAGTEVEAEAAEPAPATLIMIESGEDAAACDVDGWCN